MLLKLFKWRLLTLQIVYVLPEASTNGLSFVRDEDLRGQNVHCNCCAHLFLLREMLDITSDI